jgi:glycosyltransferase involved in cell wall biosynthesis
MSFGSRSAKLAFLAAQTVSLVAAHRVITGSEAAREVLRRFFPRSWRKSETILDGVEDLFVPGAQPGRRAYVLYVGGRDERKNLRGVFLGYAAAVARGGMELPLHVAGGRESLLPGDAAVLDGLPEEVRHRIRFIGFVADSQMPELYRDAAALLFPSRGERFGFPPLEAIACGTPVVTTRLGSIPEVVGEAALFADPDDPGAIGAALVSAVTDEAVRARLVSAGIRRADDLRWRACVDRTAAVYRRLAQRP